MKSFPDFFFSSRFFAPLSVAEEGGGKYKHPLSEIYLIFPALLLCIPQMKNVAPLLDLTG